MKSVNLKVIFGYLIILVVSMFFILFMVQRSGDVKESVTQFIDGTLPTLKHVDELNKIKDQYQLSSFGFYGYTLNQAEFSESLAQTKNAFHQEISGLTALNIKTDQLLQLYQQLDQQGHHVLKITGAAKSSGKGWDAARDSLSLLTEKAVQVEKALAGVRQQVEAMAKEDSLNIMANLETMSVFLGSMVLFIFAATFVAYRVSSDHIVRPLDRLTQHLRHLASDLDFSKTATVERPDELGLAAESVNALSVSFKETVVAVNSAVSEVGEAISSLAQATSTSESNVENLKSRTESVLNSTHGLEQQIQASVTKSEMAKEAAVESAETVKRGSGEMQSTADAIVELAEGIEVSATKISALKDLGDRVSGVVGTIAAIADQTNLLALNAAIEAARAGESGRGFAVVADEVRTLATRTRQSTQEINDILEQIVGSIVEAVNDMENNRGKTNHLVDLAKTTVDTLDDTHHRIISMSDLNQAIVDMAAESQLETQRVLSEAAAFNSIAQEVANGSVTTSSASQDLATLAGQLNQKMKVFRF